MTLRALLLLFVVLGQVLCAAASADLRWSEQSVATVPIANGTLATLGKQLVCLGAASANAKEVVVFTLDESTRGWQRVAEFPVGTNSVQAAAGDAASMLVIASADDNETKAFLLTANPANAPPAIRPLSKLPVALRNARAAIIAKTAHVIGPDAAGTVHHFSINLDSTTWRTLPVPSVSIRHVDAVAVQSDGSARRLFLLARDNTSQLFSFDLKNATWRTLAAPPTNELRTLLPSGQAHLIAAGNGLQFYHAITNTWSPASPSPHRISQLARSGDSIFAVTDEQQVIRGEFDKPRSRFSWPDYLALAAYPLCLLVMGYVMRVRNNADQDAYFRGGRRIPWWAAGLSLVATQVSAIGFVAIPAKTFATDWTYFAGIASWFIVAPIVTWKFIPMYQRLNVTTAYEYLEIRFDFLMRALVSVLFMINQVTRAAVVLYLPAIALSAVTGIDKIWCIVAMGGVTTVYTVLGGMQTVIWTDVLQAIALLGGALLCVGLIVFNVGGVGPFFTAAMSDGKLNLVSSDWSSAEASLWIVFFGGVFARLSGLISDQNVVQRYQSTANAKQASKALWADVAVSIPWAFTIFLLGTALYVYFKIHPNLLDPTMDTDQIVPQFIAQGVPVGLAGLIVAAIFAASLDGSMLAVATTFVNDLYSRARPNSSPKNRIVIVQVLTIVLGAFATSIALLLAVSNIRSLWDLAIQMSGLFTGAIAGVFVAGLFLPRVGARAALVGVLASGVMMYFVERGGWVHVLFYAGMGIITSVVVAWLASFFWPRRARPADVGDQTAVPEVVL